MFLQKNSFTGEIPRFFAKSLGVLDVSYNLFTGKLSKTLLDSQSLIEFLGATMNCLDLEISDSICMASNLRNLHLDGMGSAGAR